MNPPDEQMRAVKSAMGKDDPAVAVLGTMATKIGSMQECLQAMAGKVDAIHETGATLRIARVRNFWLILFLGMVLGALGTGYWMSAHGFTGVFWQHGIKVYTAENSDHLQFSISGINIEKYDYMRDKDGKIIGFWATYRKVGQPKETYP